MYNYAVVKWKLMLIKMIFELHYLIDAFILK